MSFSPNWLALREPADHAARDTGLLVRATVLAGSGATIADLGSGTGSTARAFTDGICADWTWHFMDSDRALLDIAKDRHPLSHPTLVDLSDIDALALDDVDLVTASALLDLMPQDWVETLAIRLKSAAVPFYAAINYNGVMRWTPEMATDDQITTAFNQHQRTDKGIGPALGPHAASEAANIFESHGFNVILRDSPWKLGADQADLHRMTLSGIAHAAVDAGLTTADDWGAARIAKLDKTAGYIGHTDLLAIPHGAGA